MDASDHSRKLTVILAADVAGYSRMVATDDVATVQTLNSYRDIFRSKITAYHGQVIDTAGDSVLAQFASALEAVQCGLEIQSELKTRNDTLAMNRRMLFRMGINIGDVLQQTDGTIYGDGVNIAARLESLSVPGGVTISGTVYDQVKTRLRSSFTFLGEQHVKNIPEPIRTYAVTEAAESQPGALLDPGKASTTRPRRMSLYVGGGVGVLLLVLFVSAMVALREGPIDAALPRSDTQSQTQALRFAVMPFENLSGDTHQDFFADGVTDEVITTLGSFQNLRVAARHNSFRYKGNTLDDPSNTLWRAQYPFLAFLLSPPA